MKIIILIFTIISSATHAQGFLQKIEEIQNINLESPKSACTQPSEASGVCDIFSQACYDKDGNNSPTELADKVTKENKKLIMKAYDKYAKALGSENFDQILKKHLEQVGFKLGSRGYESPYNITEVNFSDIFLNKEDEWSLGNYINDFSCKEASDKFKASVPDPFYVKFNEFDEQKKGEIEATFKTKFLEIQNLINNQFINLYTHDPIQILELASDICKKQKEKCSNKDQHKIKLQILDLKRKGFPKDETSELIKLTINKLNPAKEIVYQVDESKGIEDQIQAITYPNCYELDSVTNSVGKTIFSNFMKEVNTSKIVIENTIESFYGKPTDKIFSKIDEFKDFYIDVFTETFGTSGLIKEKEKLDLIVDQYKALKILRIKPPSDKDYFEKNGQKYLNTSALISPESDLISMYETDNLDWFTTLNAYYLPRAFGEEFINIFPVVLNIGAEMPESLYGVFAHELAHKVGPKVSTMNNHDLNPELNALMECMKTSESFSMSSHQTEESFSDWFSAEVMVKFTKKYPKFEHKKMLKNVLADFCIFGNDLNFNEDEHPDPVYRVNYIFGAHPFFKETFGCSANSEPKYCELKK